MHRAEGGKTHDHAPKLDKGQWMSGGLSHMLPGVAMISSSSSFAFQRTKDFLNWTVYEEIRGKTVRGHSPAGWPYPLSVQCQGPIICAFRPLDWPPKRAMLHLGNPPEWFEHGHHGGNPIWPGI
eukprot:scaffold30165_cov38-Prasinocladus_malaysianus.AAC.1